MVSKIKKARTQAGSGERWLVPIHLPRSYGRSLPGVSGSSL
jgi:hypothetical protein